MSTYAGQYGPEPCLDSNGHLLKSASVPVHLTGTNTLAVLYTDRTKAQTTPNPTTSDFLGNLEFFADPGGYDIVVNGTTLGVVVAADSNEGFTPATVVGVLPSTVQLSVQMADGTVRTMDFLASYSPNVGDVVATYGTTVIGPKAGVAPVTVPVNASITTASLMTTSTFNAPTPSVSNTATSVSITTPSLVTTSAFNAPTPTIANKPSIVQHSAAKASASGTTVTVTLPSGTAAGNRVVVCIIDANATPTAPDGTWALDASATRVGSYVFSKASAVAGQTSWAFTTSGTGTAGYAYELANAVSLAGASTADHDNSAATCGPTSSVTPAQANNLSVLCFTVGSATATALANSAGTVFTFDANDLALDATGFATGHLVQTSATAVTTTVAYTAGASGNHSSSTAIAVYNGGAAATGAAASMSVAVPNSAVVGSPVNATVTALDANGNVATTYSGTVNFTSTDAKATLPANGRTLTNGTAVYSVTFGQAGTFTVTATDSVSAGITGTSASCIVAASTGAKQARVAAGLTVSENNTTLSFVDPWLAWQTTYVPSAYQGVRPPVGWVRNYVNWKTTVNTAAGNVPPWLNSSGTNVAGGNGTTQKVAGVIIHIPLAYTGGPTVQQVAAGAADSILNPGTGSSGGFVGGPVAVVNKMIAAGQKVVLTLGLECDATWAAYPWTTSGATAYKAAFQEQSAFWRKNCPGVLIAWNAFAMSFPGQTAAQLTTQAQAWDPGLSFYDINEVDTYVRASSTGGENATDMQTSLGACSAYALKNNKLFGVGEIDWQQDDPDAGGKSISFQNAVGDGAGRGLLDGLPAPPATITGGGTFNGGLLYWALFQIEANDVPQPYGITNYPSVLKAYQARMGLA